MSAHVRRSVTVALTVVLALTGCAHSAKQAAVVPTTPPASMVPAATAPAPAKPHFPAYAATARGRSVPVFDRPAGRVTTALPNPGLLGAPLTFLVVRQQSGWLLVRLPVKPNGATGWVRSRDVRLSGLRYRLDLHRRAHQLQLYDDGRLVRTFPVAVGTTDTPTPGGTYYLDALVRTDDPAGVYGPYAFGLNAFPPGIEVFNGQQAVIGLHGTNRPDLIGQDVSHGCIRMRNADITALAGLLPLGTPVRILS